VWGDGDAVGLKTHQRPYGRISGLNCWEHNTMLPGYVLAAEWPRQLLLSRAFASQAACYVIAVGGMRLSADTPERYRELSTFEHTGDSCIIDPRGEIIAGPAQGETNQNAEGSMEAVRAAKALSDIGGHYSRPDLFRMIVDRSAPERVAERGGAGEAEAQTG
jgi:predicted amidohydrolase